MHREIDEDYQLSGGNPEVALILQQNVRHELKASIGPLGICASLRVSGFFITIGKIPRTTGGLWG